MGCETNKYGIIVKDVRGPIYCNRAHRDIFLHSAVYRNYNSFIKKGSDWLIDNEARFLQIIGDGINFPKLLKTGVDNDEHWIEISVLPGEELFKNKWALNIWDIKNYAIQLLSLLEILYHRDIIHRDIQHENILVSKNNTISIIDFAYAIDFRKDSDYISPKLGSDGSPEVGYSDFYNLAKVFEKRYGKMPYVHNFSKELKKIDWKHYLDSDYVSKHIFQARKSMLLPFTFVDLYEFINAKYKLFKYFGHPIKAWKRIF